MHIFVTGTDTGIGKTVFAAGLTRFLDGSYWKPIQSGLLDETDSQSVARLTGLPADRIHAERYRLKTPASPHLAAEIDAVSIDADRLTLPESERPLIIEGAGGLMVPLTRQTLYVDVLARWSIPTVLCARTSLGTINHTLLSLEALRNRRVPVVGVAFIGDEHVENARIIASLGQIKVLGRLPWLKELTSVGLNSAFEQAFVKSDFLN
jgi:dethiobiotin synthetase